jgi:GntR family transcriptional regulator
VTTQADTVGSQPLDFAIDRNAEVPIGVQLAWALRARIRDGRLTPGQRLPGLRDLAETLKVNANTVRAVYQRLEHEGIIESLRGSGTFVAAAPAAGRSAVGTIAANAAREALRTGVDPREVAAALYVEPAVRREPDQLERRQRLRTQIAALEQTLAEIEVAHPRLLPTKRATRRGRGPRLLEADELEQVQTDLIRRLAALQIAIDEAADQPQDDGLAGLAERPEAVVPASVPDTAPKRPVRSRAKTRPAPAGA